MADFMYYTMTVTDDLVLHFWYQGVYASFSFLENRTRFGDKVAWLTQNQTFYKISYRGGHVEKPIMIAFQALDKVGLPSNNLVAKIQELQSLKGSPSKRLGQILREVSKTYYQAYLDLLTQPLMLDIETFDGRIYHNRFDRLEIQAQLRPAESTKDYLKHLEIIFQTKEFQRVFRQKYYLLKNFAGHFATPVNATTTDAQLTESFYTQGKLADARSVYISKTYLPFTYFLKGSLADLYQAYQNRQPKQAIYEVFGKNGAITQLGDFVISSAASAPMGFQIKNFNPQKSWTNQIKTLRYKRAIRLDLSHIQATILKEIVADSYFKEALGQVLDKWQKEPDHRPALNRLLYPIQGTMDTPFSHNLHTPRYAYSMRLIHNLLLVGFLTTLVSEGMRPISLNNEVIFLETTHFQKERFEAHLKVLETFYDYRPVDNLIIKDTNNYTYFDQSKGRQIFRGASFNHHDGADVTTNIDTPPFVDFLLQQMIMTYGDFREELVEEMVFAALEKSDSDTLKEYLMVPIYPLKKRYQYLYKKDKCLEVQSAMAYFASQSDHAWSYKQFYESPKKKPDSSVQDFLKKYHLPASEQLQEVAGRQLRLEEIDQLSLEKVNVAYYIGLIKQEINLWK
ncbi:hypothetical protein ACVR0P_05695 [Streptococcus castoreus]|uniref:hypothetical protein n=1 Tax=Streptococcus castoreus TaxID=254786 RepID=UPI0004242451|nr:hypothetical protein [Streptococcus castoreus]